MTFLYLYHVFACFKSTTVRWTTDKKLTRDGIVDYFTQNLYLNDDDVDNDNDVSVGGKCQNSDNCFYFLVPNGAFESIKQSYASTRSYRRVVRALPG